MMFTYQPIGGGGGERDTTGTGKRGPLFLEGREKPERVKWLEIILHSGLQFQDHLMARVRRAFFFFFLNCTSRGTYVHSGTPGPEAPGT